MLSTATGDTPFNGLASETIALAVEAGFHGDFGMVSPVGASCCNAKTTTTCDGGRRGCEDGRADSWVSPRGKQVEKHHVGR